MASQKEYITPNDTFTIYEELYPVRAKWYNLGGAMKVTKACLDAIKTQYREDPSDCLREVISEWLQNVEMYPKWATIVAALKTKIVSELQLAAELEEKHCPQDPHLLPPLDPSMSTKAAMPQLPPKGVRVFCLFITSLIMLLEEEEGALKRMQTFLQQLARTLQSTNGNFFIPEAAFMKARTVREFFSEIAPLYNYIDTDFLQDIVEASNCHQAIKKLQQFLAERACVPLLQLEEELRTTHDIGTNTSEQNHEATEHPESTPGSHSHAFAHDTFVVSTQPHIRSVDMAIPVTMKTSLENPTHADYEMQKQAITSIWNLPSAVLTFFGCGTGSFIVTYTIPAQYASYIKLAPVSEAALLLLRQNHILELSVGDDHIVSSYSRIASALTEPESQTERPPVAEPTTTEKPALSSLTPTPVPEQTTSGKPALPSLQTTATPVAEQATTEKPDPRAFLMACKDGDEKKVVTLIMQGVDVNSRDELGQTGLHLASEEGHSKVVENLISHGAELNLLDSNDLTPLMLACFKNHPETVEVLVGGGVALDIQGQNGKTALIVASYSSKPKVIQILVSAGASLDIQDQKQWTALMIASRYGSPESVHTLVSAGAALDIQEEQQVTALMCASRYGSPESVHALVSAGAALDIQDKDGNTALNLASQYSHPETVHILTEAGAALDIQDNEGWSPLMSASRYGHPKSVQVLVEAGAALDIQNQEGLTALYLATYENKPETVKILVEAGAGLDIQRDNGWTALMVAAREDHHEIVQTLVAARAALDIRQKDGWTALMLATGGGHLQIVQTLTSAGAALDMQEEGGLTALMTAVNGGHSEIVQELTRAGANPDIQDKDGLTALMLATKKASLTIIECLLQSGASPNVAEKTSGWTALFFAAKDGNTEIVQILIKSGCDTNAKDKNDITPLDIARTHSRGEVCEELRKTTPHVDRAPLSESTLKRLIKSDNFFRTLFKRLEERMQQIAHPEKFKKEALSQREKQALSIDSSHPLN